MEPIDEIAKRIKEKKELSGLDSSVVREAVQGYVKKHNLDISVLREPEKKQIVKEIRAELRISSGMFQISPEKRQALLAEGKIDELLRTHSSTKERLDFYPEIRRMVDSLKINSILDLGCGLNPIAMASGMPNVAYYASDISKENLSLIEGFFKKKNIAGKTFVCNLKNIKSCALPEAELCILFQVFDAIEKRGHKLAEQIINSLNCRYLLISFSTKTLAQKPMRHPQRGWIERLFQRLGFKFKLIKSKNEIFYLAEKMS